MNRFVDSEFMKAVSREKRRNFSRAIMGSIDEDCMTRKPRDPVKRDLMRHLGLPERFREANYPSPGNTPPDLYEGDL
ncbi:MAG: hypothetical protein ABIC40_01545 [bacterium]